MSPATRSELCSDSSRGAHIRQPERSRSMSPETESTLLDPVTPQNAVLLLVDQQEG